MARDYYINGETLVTAAGSEFALADSPIVVNLNWHHLDIHVDSFGDVPPEVQFMLSEARVSFTAVNFDRAVLDTLLSKTMGGASIGQMPSAGTRMGTGATKNFFPLFVQSLAGAKSWTFPNCYMIDGLTFPHGAERSLVVCSFRALPFPAGGDPKTANGSILWTYS